MKRCLLSMSVDEAIEVIKDFRKCDDLANRMDALMPESPGAFTGTVSERLTRTFNLMQCKKKKVC